MPNVVDTGKKEKPAAALNAFDQEEWELKPVATIRDIFQTVHSCGASYGIVPFENSTNGPVLLSFNGFADYEDRYTSPDLGVCGEVYVDVRHYLLGHDFFPASASSTPGHGRVGGDGERTGVPLVDLEGKVKRIYSHPQVWGQCERFLSTFLGGVEQVDVPSTSKAAELVFAEGMSPPSPGGDGGKGGKGGGGGGGKSVAISSLAAARLTGLDVLAKRIEDREDNTTRFFVIRRERDSAIPGLPENLLESLPPRPSQSSTAPTESTSTAAEAAEAAAGETPSPASETAKTAGAKVKTRTKTLIRFTVPHSSPGALADVLSCFRRRGLNLTSINSRPNLRGRPFTYVFFVEFEGHTGDEYDGEGKVKEVLEEVGTVAEEAKWLGSWVCRR
ncbi:hypothetical protein MKZ38_003413 [Zalerion maritima]|uniref:prephenate dehydratase n=1 Tax=Zalerion maritima TaxID=339359 RepID=A0AAD5RMR9_9PEZI|nr:hypothetical protein MKZ38_003413 [Zalerion maritima]